MFLELDSSVCYCCCLSFHAGDLCSLFYSSASFRSFLRGWPLDVAALLPHSPHRFLLRSCSNRYFHLDAWVR